jgi:replicative DNA helicase
LQDKRIAREVIVKMDELTTNYYKSKFDTDFNFLTSAEMQISEIVRTRKIDGFKGIKEVAAKIKENIEIARQSDDALIGFDTGLNQLNKYTSGMQKGQMVVIAARPGVGKTALGLNICFNVAKKYKRPVLVFSAEMSEEEVFTRILSKASNINGNKINTGQLSSDDTIKLNAAIKQISDVPLLVSYCNGVTIGEIVNKTTKFQTEHPDLAMIMIDYIGLIKTGQKEESLRIEIAKISHALKKLATDLQIPVIVVSQVRRTQESIPQMSDLRDSGDIEQDADKVILLYRDDYDNETKKKKATSMQDNQANVAAMDNKEKEASGGLKENNTSVVEAIVAKNRNGQTGTGVLLFLKSYQSFGNPTDEFIEDYKLKKKNVGIE